MTLWLQVRHRSPSSASLSLSRELSAKLCRQGLIIVDEQVAHLCCRHYSTNVTAHLLKGGKGWNTTTTSPASRSFSSLLPPKPGFAAPVLPPRVVSRRSWEAYQQQHAETYDIRALAVAHLERQQQKHQKSNQNNPWPRSVIWTGYALAATLIPYFTIWYLVSDEATRPLTLSLLIPPSSSSRDSKDGDASTMTTLERVLRSHFGEPEIDAVPYPARSGRAYENTLDPTVVPHVFKGEIPAEVRHQQWTLEQQLQSKEVFPVRVRVYDPEGHMVFDETPTTMSPGTLALARNVLPRTVNNLAPQTSVALDFPEREDDKKKGAKKTVLDDDTSNQFSLGDSSLSSREEQEIQPQQDPLLAKVHTFSLWHYQPVAPSSNNKKANSLNQEVSAEDLQRSQLRYDIDRLEQELKSGTSLRPQDDIQMELNANKKELRRLQWKKWFAL